MKVAVIGATGLVGHEILRALERFNYPVTELLPVASERSAGKEVHFKNTWYPVVDLTAGLAAKPDVALFSAGGATSTEWAPKFVAAGALVIDNSSAWRMDPSVPLVVPEINLAAVGPARLIANPNCSTIQLVMALKPLHDRYGLRRVLVSTYQSVTGTGKAAVNQLAAEEHGETAANTPYPHPIHRNVLPHCDVFVGDDGYTKEELKVVNETRKILALPELAVSCTAVRVPAVGGHSESVNVQFAKDFELGEVRRCLAEFPGVMIQDDPATNTYPMPISAHCRDEVFVGRIRRDFSAPNSLHLWVVADNLRKGAATNAVQIAKALLERQPA